VHNSRSSKHSKKAFITIVGRDAAASYKDTLDDTLTSWYIRICGMSIQTYIDIQGSSKRNLIGQ